MRTTIEIDDKLWEEITNTTGIRIKKRVIETVFREYIRMKRRKALSDMIGNYKGFNLDQDDLRKMRSEEFETNQ